MVPEFEDDKIRELIGMNYRIVYYLTDQFRVDILTVNRCDDFSEI